MEPNKDLHVEIISLAGYLFNGDCHMAVIPAVKGEMGIMAGHESLISSLKEGKILIQDYQQNVIKEFDVEGGYAEMLGNKLLILVD